MFCNQIVSGKWDVEEDAVKEKFEAANEWGEVFGKLRFAFICSISMVLILW